MALYHRNLGWLISLAHSFKIPDMVSNTVSTKTCLQGATKCVWESPDQETLHLFNVKMCLGDEDMGQVKTKNWDWDSHIKFHSRGWNSNERLKKKNNCTLVKWNNKQGGLFGYALIYLPWGSETTCLTTTNLGIHFSTLPGQKRNKPKFQAETTGNFKVFFKSKCIIIMEGKSLCTGCPVFLLQSPLKIMPLKI